MALAAPRAVAARAKPATARKPAAHTLSVKRGPQVIYLTAHTAYLGQGSAEGMAVGMTVPLRRNRQVVASCQIASVAEHYASCPAQPAMRVGDTFAPPAPPAPPAAPAKPLPPLLGKEETAKASAALTSSTFEPVAFNESGGVGEIFNRRLRGELDVGVGVFSANTQPDHNFTVLEVNAAVRGAELGGGFRASIDVTALQYLQRPPTYRFPETSLSQVFVRQLELSFRTPSSPLAFAVGRIWPFLAPGVGVLDGAQVGWHNGSNTLESGLLGGTTPDAVTTAPAWNYPLVGAYLSTTQTSRDSNSWFQGSAVVTGRELAGIGWHYALEGLGLWSLGKSFDASAQVRLGAGVLQAPSYVEFASLDLNFRPSEHSRLAGTVRYLNDTLAQFVQPAALGPTNSSLRANAVASYDFDAVSAMVLGVFDRDIITTLWRAMAGEELTFPRLLGQAGSVTLGGDQSWGWYSGWDAYLQATLFPEKTFQLILRGGYFVSVTQVTSTSPAENGINATLEARLWAARWLSLQATLYSQLALAPLTAGLPMPFGLNAIASATAHF
jgi:hypothetical protein